MTQTTKRALAESLKRLLETKGLSRITVADITEGCGVSRHTFYYHFRDVYDLVEWIYQTELAERLEEQRSCGTWQEGLSLVLRYVQENHGLVHNAYHSKNRELLLDYLHELTYRLLRDVIEEKTREVPVSEEHKHFIASFYRYGFVGLMLEWVETGMKQTPEQLVDDLSRMLQGELLDAMEKSKEQ